MTTSLGLTTRFGGTLHIDSKDIAKASLRHEGKTNTLDVIWDKIKDWFFGTNLVEAKNHLAKLYAPDASGWDRVTSYYALKELVGEGYRGRFVETTDATGHTLSIVYGDDLPPYTYRTEFDNSEQVELPTGEARITREIGVQISVEAKDAANAVQAEEVVAPAKPPRGIMRATPEVVAQTTGDNENAAAGVKAEKNIPTSKPAKAIVIDTAKAAKVWGEVKNWFATDDSATAREHLERLYAANASNSDRVESYQALKNLAADEYRKNFTEVTKPFGYSLVISFGKRLPAYSHNLNVCSRPYLQKACSQMVRDVLRAPKSAKSPDPLEHEERLAADLTGATYSIDGEPINGLDSSKAAVDLLNTFRSALNAASTLPDRQRTAVEALVLPALFEEIVKSTLVRNGGVFEVEEAAGSIRVEGAALTYDLSRMGDNIVLRASQNSEWFRGAEMSPMLFAPISNIAIAITPAGNVTVMSANFGSEAYDA